MVEFTKDELWTLYFLLVKKVEYGGSVDEIKDTISTLDKVIDKLREKSEIPIIGEIPKIK